MLPCQRQSNGHPRVFSWIFAMHQTSTNKVNPEKSAKGRTLSLTLNSHRNCLMTEHSLARQALLQGRTPYRI